MVCTNMVCYLYWSFHTEKRRQPTAQLLKHRPYHFGTCHVGPWQIHAHEVIQPTMAYLNVDLSVFLVVHHDNILHDMPPMHFHCWRALAMLCPWNHVVPSRCCHLRNKFQKHRGPSIFKLKILKVFLLHFYVSNNVILIWFEMRPHQIGRNMFTLYCGCGPMPRTVLHAFALEWSALCFLWTHFRRKFCQNRSQHG